MSTTTTTERRAAQVDEIVRVRTDGAQEWDCREYVREKEAGDAAAEPWRIGDAKGARGLTDAEIAALVAEADAVILASVSGDLAVALARQVTQRRVLYARAVQAGELSVALHCLRDESRLMGLYDAPAQPKKKLSHEDRVARIVRALAAPEGAGVGESAEPAKRNGAGPGGKTAGG